MATTQQQIEVIMQDAFGRPATKEELDYYSERGVDLLETNLRNDPNVGGKYASDAPTDDTPTDGPPISNAPEDKPESYEEWLKGAGSQYRRDAKGYNIRKEYQPFFDKQIGGLDEEQRIGGQDKRLALRDLDKLKGRSQEDLEKLLENEAKQRGIAREDLGKIFSRERQGKRLAKEDYVRALGELKYGKEIATEDYNRSTERTERGMGEQAAESGLFGSGQYQEELGEQLGDMQRGYERQYGDDPNSQHSRQVAGTERDWQRQYASQDSEYRQRLGDYQKQFNREYKGEDSASADRIGGYQQDYQRGLEDIRGSRGDINRQYERDWGTGEYSTYSKRKFGIEQDRETYVGGERQTREQQGYNQYLRQYDEGGQYYTQGNNQQLY